MATDNPLSTNGSNSACRFLASKGQYITGFLDPAAENCGVGDGYCWCNQTQEQFGPDDDFVGRDRCVVGRVCFVPLLT